MITLKVDTETASKVTSKDIVYTYVYEFMGPLSEKDKDAIFSKILDVINLAQAEPTYDVKADPLLQLKDVEVNKEPIYNMLTKIVNEYFAGEDPLVLEMWAHDLLKAINEFIATIEKEGGK